MLSPAIQASNPRPSFKDTPTFAPTRRLTDSLVATNPSSSQDGRTRTPPIGPARPKAKFSNPKTLSYKG